MKISGFGGGKYLDLEKEKILKWRRKNLDLEKEIIGIGRRKLFRFGDGKDPEVEQEKSGFGEGRHPDLETENIRIWRRERFRFGEGKEAGEGKFPLFQLKPLFKTLKIPQTKILYLTEIFLSFSCSCFPWREK